MEKKRNKEKIRKTKNEIRENKEKITKIKK